MSKERRIELHLSLPLSEAKELMLHIHNKNGGQIETFNNDANHHKYIAHQYPDGTTFRKLPMKVLNQALNE